MFERREGLACHRCDSCSRYRHLASVLLDKLGASTVGCENLSDYTRSDHFRQLEVAEINRCGAIHKFLNRHPNLHYSDYGSTDPDVPSEDLLDLSYKDRQFDLVLTTDTLEHVPDLDLALSEIERILKPGGRHIFTVPTVWDGRKTLQRAVVEGGQITHLQPPSYHGAWSAQQADRLVFHEFGNDVLEYLKTANTRTTIERVAGNLSLTVFVTVKNSGTEPEQMKPQTAVTM
jgi:SAM-dependent methyltransferase